jgi:predicted nucleic acid-binding protein
MIYYLDSSVIMRYLLQHSGFIRISDLEGKFITSELTFLECRRTLIRYRLNSEIKDQDLVDLFEDLNEFISYIDLIGVNSKLLNDASQNWGVTLGSLDSIHLATALYYKNQTNETLTLLTHDKALSMAARLLGIMVEGG